MRQKIAPSTIAIRRAVAAWSAVLACALVGCQSLSLDMARGKVEVETELANLDDDPPGKKMPAVAHARQDKPITGASEAGDGAAVVGPSKSVSPEPSQKPSAASMLAEDDANPRTAFKPDQRTDRVARTDVADQDFDAVIAELQTLGAIDPLTRQRLIDDLKKTDPALWPLLIQYFRASLAQHMEDRQIGSPANVRLASAAAAVAKTDKEIVTPREPNAKERSEAAPRFIENETPQAPSKVVPPGAGSGTSSQPQQPSVGQETTITQKPADTAAANSVVAAEQGSGGDWRGRLQDAIASLEADLAALPATPDHDARLAQLRLLQLAAGQREAALKPAAAWPAAQQQFWSEELFGLATYLDAERTPDHSRRAAEASRRLGEAAVSLGEAASLVVRNLAFCSEIKDFGLITRFDDAEFKPGEKVLLYAEVENFKSLPTPRGYHTALTASYQVFDAEGRRVEEHEFPPTEEHCQNRRRDFFIPFVITLPVSAYDGRHTLRLTVEDTLGQKIGQSTIDFTIRTARKADAAARQGNDEEK